MNLASINQNLYRRGGKGLAQRSDPEPRPDPIRNAADEVGHAISLFGQDAIAFRDQHGAAEVSGRDVGLNPIVDAGGDARCIHERLARLAYGCGQGQAGDRQGKNEAGC